jgi:hypothetical protein
MNPLEQAAADLEQAIAQGLYEEAQFRLARYRLLLDQRLITLSPGDPAFAALCHGSRGLLERALRSAQASQAHDAARLRTLIRTAAYGRVTPPPARHTWKLDG